MVVSVRRAWPSLWHCLTLDFLYSTCSEGTTPSVRTRVRKRPGVRRVTRRLKLHLIGAPEVEILPDDLFEEAAAGDGTIEDLGQGELGLQDGELVPIAGRSV